MRSQERDSMMEPVQKDDGTLVYNEEKRVQELSVGKVIGEVQKWVWSITLQKPALNAHKHPLKTTRDALEDTYGTLERTHNNAHSPVLPLPQVVSGSTQYQSV